jgi:large subunit ribosomal protein L25
LSGSVRSNVGKKDAAALRRADLVPCVLYGQGTQTHFSAKKNDIEKLVFTPEVYQVELDIDGQKATAIIQDIQQDPIKGTVRHIDFFQLDANKPVRVGLPVRLTGASRGVLAGGKLLQVFRRLTVVGLPGSLPDAITIDITKLRIGQSIRVSQIDSNDLKFLEPANAVVVSVKMARGAAKGSDADDEEEEEA